MPNPSSDVLRAAIEDTATRPDFCGHQLAGLRRRHNLTLEEQAASLGLGLERLAKLALCRVPADQAEMDLIAGYVGLDPERLAEVLGPWKAR